MSVSLFRIVIEAFVGHEFLHIEIKAEKTTEGIELLVESSEEYDFALFFSSVDWVVKDKSLWDCFVRHFWDNFEDVWRCIIIGVFISFKWANIDHTRTVLALRAKIEEEIDEASDTIARESLKTILHGFPIRSEFTDHGLVNFESLVFNDLESVNEKNIFFFLGNLSQK